MITRLRRCYPRLQNITMLGSEIKVATGTDIVNNRVVLLKETSRSLGKKTVDIHEHCQKIGVDCPKIYYTHLYNHMMILECEYVEGSDLMDWMLLGNEVPVMSIMKQLITLVNKYKEHDLSHLDIKPENIIWNDDTQTVRIIDYESMRPHTYVGTTPIYDAVGTTSYLSPEVHYDNVYHKNTDLWNIGMVGLVIILRHNPLVGERVKREELRQYSRRKLKQLGTDPELTNLICRLLNPNPIWRNPQTYKTPKKLRSWWSRCWAKCCFSC